MEKTRSRFTILPVLVALLCGVMTLPALNIFRINARGVGDLAITPTRKASLGERLLKLQAHPAFRPATAALALLVAWLTGQHGLALGAVPFLMGALTEGQHAGEFIMEERGGIGAPSRENITVLSGQSLYAGSVIGRKRFGVGKMAIPTVTGTGNGLMSAVFPGQEVQVGTYTITCSVAATNAGTFTVTNPAGKALPTAAVGTSYTSREVNFLISDGSTDFIVGDSFALVVGTGTPTVVGTGNGTVSAISLGPDARPGRYRIENITAITNGGTFKIVGPSGQIVDVGSIVAGAGGTWVLAAKRHLNITITDASTDFVVGDFFEVVVYNELNGGKVVAWDPTTFDGRHEAFGALYDRVDASSSDLAGVIVTRDATFMKTSLQWGTSITAAQKESAYLDLAKRGIVCR